MSKDDLLSKIEHEILTNKRKYLENCKAYYGDYISAAKILFKEYYDGTVSRHFNKKDAYSLYNSKAIECKKNNDAKGEAEYLKLAIENNADTPYSYERLAILYSKDQKHEEAYEICMKWFNSIYWKIPNMANGSLKILNRLEKLEKKLKNE